MNYNLGNLDKIIDESKKYSLFEVFVKLKDKFTKTYDFRSFDKIVISGMGASGIIGDILQDLLENKEIIVNKSYEIPKFVKIDRKNNKTSYLFIAISYSGNTEETLYSLKEALKLGLPTVFISSNESIKNIKEHLRKNNILDDDFEKLDIKDYFPLVFEKTELPPRYNFVQLIISTLSLFYDIDFIIDIFKEADKLKDKSFSLAKNILKELVNKNIELPIVYSSYKYKSLPIRIKQQFNENSKIHCISNFFSEANHNELEVINNKKHYYFLIYNEDDHNRIKKRFEIISDLFKEKDFNFVLLNLDKIFLSNSDAQFDDFNDIKDFKELLRRKLIKILLILNVFDLVSIGLALLNNREFNENKQITYLKNRLKD